jgi:hypothetical protein
MADTSPKVFISYSWSSPQHQALVKDWAERLVADGIDVVLDLYDLKEGHDKYAFMERMVTDESVSHVLVVCDSRYTQKADARKAGVGTESQIISSEVYEKVKQSKFIPIVSEFGSDGSPCLPAFLKTRIWIDFSSPEAVNENWEQMIRLLYGKPFHEKPKLGKPPHYISDDSVTPASPVIAKFSSLKQAILQSKPGIKLFRSDFLNSCFEFVDSLRVRQAPKVAKFGEQVLNDCGKLKHARNHLVDWVLLEAITGTRDGFEEELILFLEKLYESKSRPPEISSWNDEWFGAHSVFVYETFLYVIAALLKSDAYSILHDVFSSHYLIPETERHGDERFDTFDCFFGYSESLAEVLNPAGQRYHSPAAELMKRQADRRDLPFESLIEAELLVLLMTFLTPNTRWYPGTLHYARYSRDFPLFLRATQHKGFLKLAKITGIDDAAQLRAAVKEGQKRFDGARDFRLSGNYWTAMNMDKLDTLV